MLKRLGNIYRLGIKELWSLLRDPIMLVLIVFVFTASVYISATTIPDSLNNAVIAIVDEDDSPLSMRIISAFYPPHFMPPIKVSLAEVDSGMDAGEYTFVLDIPPDFQRDVLAGRSPRVQLNVDATRMTQALPVAVMFNRSFSVKSMPLSNAIAKTQPPRSTWFYGRASTRI